MGIFSECSLPLDGDNQRRTPTDEDFFSLFALHRRRAIKVNSYNTPQLQQKAVGFWTVGRILVCKYMYCGLHAKCHFRVDFG